MNASKADEYLTVAEIASELKLNQQTIRNWIDQGSLRAVRVGPRRVRVLRSELDRMLAGEPPHRHPASRHRPILSGRFASGSIPPCKERAVPSRPTARATSPPP